MAELHWFGSLLGALARLGQPPVSLPIDGAVAVSEVLGRMKIPADLVQLVMVNHRAVAKDSVIHQGDRVALFPGEYPFFVDWKDFRSP